MRNVRQLEGNDNSCKHMKVCRTAWHAFRRITKKKPASSRYSSAPACLAGLPGRHINERRPPKGKNTFHLQHFLLLHGMHSENVFNQLCSVLLQQLLSSLSISSSIPLTISPLSLLALLRQMRRSLVNLQLSASYKKPPAKLGRKFFGVFLTGQLHKYALQLTVLVAAWWHGEERNFKIADSPFWKNKTLCKSLKFTRQEVSFDVCST